MRRFKGGGYIRQMANLLSERMKGSHKAITEEGPDIPAGKIMAMTPEERAELAKSRVYVRAPRKVVPEIFQSGEILSQHEVPSSRGYYDPEHRKRFEHRFFGIPEDAPIQQHPKYGYLSSDPYGRAITEVTRKRGAWRPPFYVNPYSDEEALRQNILKVRGGSAVTSYGPLSFLIKKGEHPRMTYTPEDSLDAWWTEPRKLVSPQITKATDMELIPSLQGKRGYVEAQIHGAVPLSSVEKVIDYQPDPDQRTRRFVETFMKLPYESVMPQESLQRYVGARPEEALHLLREEMRGRRLRNPEAHDLLSEAFGMMDPKKPVLIRGYKKGGALRRFAEGGPITPELLESVKQVESGGDPSAVGPPTKYGRALGAYQFLPQTAKEWGVDPFDPVSSRQGAQKYLSWLYGQTGSIEDALAAYNWGIGNLKKFGKEKMPLETKSYVKKVLDRLSKFQAGEQPTLASAPHNPVDPVPAPESKPTVPPMVASSSSINLSAPKDISPPPSIENDPMKDVDTILRDPMKFATSEA